MGYAQDTTTEEAWGMREERKNRKESKVVVHV